MRCDFSDMTNLEVAPPRVTGPVPFFSQGTTFEALWPTLRTELAAVLDHGKYSHGRAVAGFEAALARWTGARYALGVGSGTDALVLLLRAAGLRPGDEVVLPAFTFVATASSVVLAGGRPRFCDIDPVTYALDVNSAERAVTPRTRMILPVHLFCQLADLGGVLELARRHELTVVEDSAEAIGMRWDGVHGGLLGAGGVLSFFPTKTLGALGDAGAVLTNDPAVAQAVDALRHHGRSGRTLDHFPGIANPSVYSGLNAKMDDIQAAVLTAKLARLPADIAHRAALAAAYTQRLAGVPGIRRLPTIVARAVPTQAVYYVYLVEVDERDRLAAYLAEAGIGTEVYYPTPLHLQPCFADLGHRSGDFPNAEAACAATLALPLYADLTIEALDTVCAAIRRFYGGGGAR